MRFLPQPDADLRAVQEPIRMAEGEISRPKKCITFRTVGQPQPRGPHALGSSLLQILCYQGSVDLYRSLRTTYPKATSQAHAYIQQRRRLGTVCTWECSMPEIPDCIGRPKIGMLDHGRLLKACSLPPRPSSGLVRAEAWDCWEDRLEGFPLQRWEWSLGGAAQVLRQQVECVGGHGRSASFKAWMCLRRGKG